MSEPLKSSPGFDSVDSVLAQILTDLEVIFIDNGSPDDRSAICNGYAARVSRIWVLHQENAGQEKARNAGVDQAVWRQAARWSMTDG